MALSEGVPKEVFRSGMFRRGSEGGFRRGFGTQGILRRKNLKGVFRRDFRDMWHSPKGSEEGFEGAFGLAFGTRGVLRRKVRRGLSAGALGGVPKGFLGWAVLVVGLEIDG